MEAIKWIALASMTIDHFNRFFWGTHSYPAYCAGRLAMPLFAFIFAYNLANPNAYSEGLHARVIKRLLFFGVLATPAYMAMRHLPILFPLNIMFMLAAATGILYWLETNDPFHRIAAFCIFLISGLLVEYLWAGLLFCLTSWLFCRRPSPLNLLLWLASFVPLCYLNENSWALLTLLPLFIATQVNLKLPRIPYFFYFYYPLHLTVFYMLSRWI
jgi:hypothetical protein